MLAISNSFSYICGSRIDRSSYRSTKVNCRPFLLSFSTVEHKNDRCMEEEIWKDIPGWEGYYQASSLGRIRRIFNKRKYYDRPRKLCVGAHGYLYVILSKNNTQKRMAVHRLVAMTFLIKPMGKNCIDHINGIRDDNRVENLRWCTHKENNNNPLTIAKYKSMPRKPYTDEWRKKISESGKGKGCIPVVQLSKSGDFIRRWECAKYAVVELFGMHPKYASSITACCRGKLQSAYGYKWQYENKEYL